MDILTMAMLNGMKKSGGVGYTEPAKTVYSVELEAMEIDDPNAPDNIAGYSGYCESPPFESGKKYVITTDSDVFECTCTDFGSPEEPAYVMGNLYLAGISEEDTGESFLFACNYFPHADSHPNWKIEVYDFNGGSHITISTTETVHTIEPKYIPNYMPVVDISEETIMAAFSGSGTEVAMNTAEAAVLDDVASTKMPLLVRAYAGGDVIMSGVLWYSCEEYILYVGASGSLEFRIHQSAGEWKMQVSAIGNG